MKRYLVFYNHRYYPSGGMEDFRGDFDSVEECHAIIDPWVSDEICLIWWHIYDNETRTIIEAEVL